MTSYVGLSLDMTKVIDVPYSELKWKSPKVESGTGAHLVA